MSDTYFQYSTKNGKTLLTTPGGGQAEYANTADAEAAYAKQKAISDADSAAFADTVNAGIERYNQQMGASYDEAAAAKEQSAQEDIQNTNASYQSLFDANAAQQYAAERNLKEQMANAGLTGSGWNATNQVAIAATRSSADASTRQAKQNAVNAILQELREYKAGLETEKAQNAANAYLTGQQTVWNNQQTNNELARQYGYNYYNAAVQQDADKNNWALNVWNQESVDRQRTTENALSLWSQYGYATQPVADALGVPVGTPTSDQSYREWSRKIQEQELENDAANTKWNQALSLLQELGYAPEQVASVLGVGTGTKTADYTQQAVENAMNWAKINAGSSASGGSSGSGSADGTAAATTATTAAANAGTAAASSAGTSGSGNGSSAASASGTGGTIPSAFLTMASEIRKKVDGGDYTGAENDAYNILSSQNNTMNDAQIRNFCKVAGVSYDNIVSRVARS